MARPASHLVGAVGAVSWLAFVAVQGCNLLLGNHDAPLIPEAGAHAGDGGVSDVADAPEVFQTPYCTQPILEAGVCTDGGFTIDLSSDMHNCGRCGHDCLGGACKASTCRPANLYTEPNEGGVPNFGATVIGVQSGRIYWLYPDPSQSLSIRSFAVDGGDPSPTHVADNLGSVVAAAVDATGLYFVLNQDVTVYRVGLDGTGRMGIAGLTEAPVSPCEMALDQDRIYVATGVRHVFVVPKSADAGPELALSSVQFPPAEVVSAPPFVAWLNEPAPFMAADASGTLARDQLDDGGAQPLPSLPVGRASGLTQDGTNYYWFDCAAGVVMSLPINQPGATPAAASLPFDAGIGIAYAHGVAPQGPGAIVSIQPNTVLASTVAFCPGEAPRVLYVETAPMYGFGHAVSDDGTSLYWGTYEGYIRRLVK